jgi:hypothetical protein
LGRLLFTADIYGRVLADTAALADKIYHFADVGKMVFQSVTFCHQLQDGCTGATSHFRLTSICSQLVTFCKRFVFPNGDILSPVGPDLTYYNL